MHSLTLASVGPLRSALHKGSLCVIPLTYFAWLNFSPFCRCRIHFSAHVYGRVLLVRVHVHFPGCPGLRNRSRRDPSARWRTGRYHSMNAWHNLTSSFLSPPSPRFPAPHHFVHVTTSRIIHRLLHFLLSSLQKPTRMLSSPPYFLPSTGSHLSHLFVCSFFLSFNLFSCSITTHINSTWVCIIICRVWLRIDASFL